MDKRAERRHHKERFRKRNQKNYPHWPDAWMFGDTRCRCSRHCCGNPRRHHKDMLTIQERKDLARVDQWPPS